jgi:fimbrial chaperone protein
MRRALLRCILLMAAPLLALPLQALGADIGIMPVVVNLDKSNDRATVQVVNNGKDPVIMQAEGIAWKRVGGVDHDEATSDLVVNPPVFTVQPGQTQIVRLGLRRAAQGNAEGTYRMVLREVPSATTATQAGVSGQVRVLVALRVPVYVAPVSVKRQETWMATQDAKGNIVAHVSNAGNVHLKVGRLRLHMGDDRSSPMAEQTVGAVLFPGEERSFSLRPTGPVAGKPMTLEVMTDRGLEYVSLELPKGR